MKNKLTSSRSMLFMFTWLILGLLLGLSVIIEAQTTTNVPNVIGLNRTNAQKEIISAGLVIGTVAPANNIKAPTGSVINQSPAAGASVLTGTAVNLEVSAGPAAYVVPKVVGLTQADALTEITASDLVLGTVTQTVSETIPGGRIVSQNPTAGTLVLQGSSVNLIVSSGPP
jgi:beta-lactam-binding protein with PASTA domain